MLPVVAGQLLPGFKPVCTIRGDLSTVADSSPERMGPNGPFQQVPFDIGVSFGGTQLTAYFRWLANVCHSASALSLPLISSYWSYHYV